MKNNNIGKHLPCNMCNYKNATIVYRDGRIMIECVKCGFTGYMKEYRNYKQTDKQLT
jgi:Zn ribbon nucleic-acid-binding protein